MQRDISICSYLNPLEETDLQIEKKYFEKNASAGKFVNKVIVGSEIPPPQNDLSLIKVTSPLHTLYVRKSVHANHHRSSLILKQLCGMGL